jgi:hypothetical protein
MDWTCVPKTAVHKYHDARLLKQQVGTTPALREWGIDPVSQP